MMDKIERQTPDLTQENIDRLAELFPSVVTEALDSEGNLRHMVDFDVLRDLLSDDVVEGRRERYQFTWPGKAKARLEARTPTAKTMRPCPEKSVDWDTTQNLYIEGDNLEALKIMRETYAGKVKLIYIDPPYNTGHDFIYDDDFAQTRAAYDSESGEFDERGGRLVANLEGNGRFHSDWCSMMYPRLLLARDLLSSDGVIFISIDDGEQRNMRNICDEVFGAQNFVTQFIWRKVDAPNDNKVPVTPDHEYIVAYAKSLALADLRQRTAPDIVDAYGVTDEKGRRCRDRLLRKNGKNSLRTDRPTMWFPLTAPDGTEIWPIREDGREGCWAAGKAGIEQARAEGRLIWKKRDSGWVPYTREYAPENPTKPWMTIWNDLPAMRQTKAELLGLFGVSNVFDTPKPTTLIRRLIELVGVENSIVLDFFSGSAACGDAVMRLNASESRNNQFILVQIDEQCADGSIAHSIDLHKITDIGEERIRRAGAKIVAEVEKANSQLKFDEQPKPVPDVGFRVLRVDESVLKDTLATPSETQQASLLDLVDNLKDGATDLDLLFQVLPKFRIEYSANIEKRDISGNAVFDVNEDQLLACFDSDVSTETITAIAKEQPLYAVFRDASFADDSAVANLEELFKTFSPGTIRRVV